MKDGAHAHMTTTVLGRRENLDPDFLPWMSQQLSVAHLYKLLGAVSKGRLQRYLSVVVIKDNKVSVIPVSSNPMRLTANRVRPALHTVGKGGGGRIGAGVSNTVSTLLHIVTHDTLQHQVLDDDLPSCIHMALRARADGAYQGGPYECILHAAVRGHAVRHERVGRGGLRLSQAYGTSCSCA